MKTWGMNIWGYFCWPKEITAQVDVELNVGIIITEALYAVLNQLKFSSVQVKADNLSNLNKLDSSLTQIELMQVLYSCINK